MVRSSGMFVSDSVRDLESNRVSSSTTHPGFYPACYRRAITERKKEDGKQLAMYISKNIFRPALQLLEFHEEGRDEIPAMYWIFYCTIRRLTLSGLLLIVSSFIRVSIRNLGFISNTSSFPALPTVHCLVNLVIVILFLQGYGTNFYSIDKDWSSEAQNSCRSHRAIRWEINALTYVCLSSGSLKPLT